MSRRFLILLLVAIVMNITGSYGSTDDIIGDNFASANTEDAQSVTTMTPSTQMTSIEIKGTDVAALV